ncbi:hypothetical protein BO71DRAFT_487808, partial [Aspergillus ellipticus CBS 707.79]
MSSHTSQYQPSEEPSSSEHTSPQRQPAFWDNLSEVFLTKTALGEIDRRSSDPQPSWRPHQSATDFLRTCTPTGLKNIKRFSRSGGPDLTDLRNTRPLETSDNDNHSSTPEDTDPSVRSISTYSRNFYQHLIDHHILPAEYIYPDDRLPDEPNNANAITERLDQRRPSAQLSIREFLDFRRIYLNATDKDQVTASVIPTLEGRVRNPRCMGTGYTLCNLAPLTNSSISPPKPDHFHGAYPEQLNPAIRQELSKQIVPSTEAHVPLAPNFFLEVKGPGGTLAEADRQACYDGALGCRAMHALQSFGQEDKDKVVHDKNAYTISSSYASGKLRIFATYIKEPTGSSDRPEYITTLLRNFFLPGNLRMFRDAIAAWRNARDWAKEQRDGLITLANGRQGNAQVQVSSNSAVHTAREDDVVVGAKRRAVSEELKFDHSESRR